MKFIWQHYILLLFLLTSTTHPCGVALVRLRKPLTYYQEKYNDPAWGLRKLYLLMEKQRNRGQDGAGMAVVKFDMPPGEIYLRGVRSNKHNAIARIFDTVMKDINQLDQSEQLSDIELKTKCHFLGNAYLGHLRYGTHSDNSINCCQPYLHENTIATKNFALAGNFNMTNSKKLFKQLVHSGLSPVSKSDTQIILERIAYCLDREYEQLIVKNFNLSGLEGKKLADTIAQEINLVNVLQKASQEWDGGYIFSALLGNGDTFVCRDPAGIRPGFFYIDDEVIAVASERAALTSVFNVEPHQVESLKPGHVLIIKQDGHIEQSQFTKLLPLRECVFERIYFSRVNDPDIYEERKALGRSLAPRILKALNNSIDHAVFSFIPNSGEAAYIGLIEEINHIMYKKHMQKLWYKIESGNTEKKDFETLLQCKARTERVAYKDQLLRTFITHDKARINLVSHVYDVTKGTIKPEDTLVIMDDSIVRGITLKEAIIKQLSTLNPKKIIVVSSAPLIMYPDCYGIDMSQLNRFIVFQAAIELLKEHNEEQLIDELAEQCKNQHKHPASINHLKKLYNRFSQKQLEAKIAELVTPKDIPWHGEVQIIYQTIEGLCKAIPHYKGDWYFSGDYPTSGGYNVVNISYLNWYNGNNARAY